MNTRARVPRGAFGERERKLLQNFAAIVNPPQASILAIGFIVPIVYLLLSVVGTYSANKNVFDLWVMLGFGVFGWLGLLAAVAAVTIGHRQLRVAAVVLAMVSLVLYNTNLGIVLLCAPLVWAGALLVSVDRARAAEALGLPVALDEDLREVAPRLLREIRVALLEHLATRVDDASAFAPSQRHTLPSDTT